MKLTKLTLQDLIESQLKEEWENLDEIDWKGLKKKAMSKLPGGFPSLDDEDSEPDERGEPKSAAELVKKLRTLTTADFTGIAPNEFPALSEIFDLLVSYAKSGNLVSGRVNNLLNQLSGYIEKVDPQGAEEPGERGEGEPTVALSKDIQDDIMNTLNIMKMDPDLQGDNPQKVAIDLKSDILDTLKQAQILRESLTMSDKKQLNEVFFTFINTLNEKKIISLTEDLAKFVKKSMKKELLSEVLKEVDYRRRAPRGRGAFSSQRVGVVNAIQKLVDMIKPGADFSKIADGLLGQLTSAGWVDRDFRPAMSTDTKAWQDDAEAAADRKTQIVPKAGTPSSDFDLDAWRKLPPEQQKLTPKQMAQKLPVGDDYFSGKWKSKSGSGYTERTPVSATGHEKLASEYEKNISGRAKTKRTRPRVTAEAKVPVFTFINQLNKQKVLPLTEKQQKKVRTMMLAETQLLTEHKLLKYLRN